MTTEQRDIILLGVALMLYGLVDAWTHGWRPSSIVRLPSLPDEITGRMEFVRSIRDELIEQEHGHGDH